jgi:hypothetical protein
MTSRSSSDGIARAAASLAAAAYLEAPAAERVCLALGATAFHWIEAGDTQAFVVVLDGRVWISFRGTERDFGDILTDVRFLRRELVEPGQLGAVGGPSVHRGFLAAFEAVEAALILAVGQCRRQDPHATIYTTGHSLGAALALIAALQLARRGFDTRRAELFGCPRTGDGDFAKLASAALNVVRHVNCCDVVPRVPFWALGYRHAGRLVYYDRQGRRHENPSLIFRLLDMALAYSGTLVDSLAPGRPLAKLLGLARSRAFTDHRVADYKRLAGVAD